MTEIEVCSTMMTSFIYLDSGAPKHRLMDQQGLLFLLYDNKLHLLILNMQKKRRGN